MVPRRLWLIPIMALPFIMWGCGESNGSSPNVQGDRPIPRSASWPSGLGVGPGTSINLVTAHDMVGGSLPIEVPAEVLARDGPYRCSVQGRFFAAGQPDARILIFRPEPASAVPLLPRDVVAEFPNAIRVSRRAHDFIVVGQGEEWELSGCDDFYVVHGRTLIGFDNLGRADPLRQGPRQPTGIPGLTSIQLGGTSRIVLPDMTFAEPDIQWDVPPENPENWVIRWTAYPAP